MTHSTRTPSTDDYPMMKLVATIFSKILYLCVSLTVFAAAVTALTLYLVCHTAAWAISAVPKCYRRSGQD